MLTTNKSLGEFYRRAQIVFDQLPRETRLRFEDGKVIGRNRDFLVGLTEGLVKGFYDTLFAHPATRSVFREGERPMREETLRHWWKRTVEGPFNAEYFAWQILLGLAHMKRGVTGAMMNAMWGFIVRYVAEEAKRSLPPEEAFALERAFGRLATTIMAMMEEGYVQGYLEALSQAMEKRVDHAQRAYPGQVAETQAQEVERYLDLLRSA